MSPAFDSAFSFPSQDAAFDYTHDGPVCGMVNVNGSLRLLRTDRSQDVLEAPGQVRGREGLLCALAQLPCPDPPLQNEQFVGYIVAGPQGRPGRARRRQRQEEGAADLDDDHSLAAAAAAAAAAAPVAAAATAAGVPSGLVPAQASFRPPHLPNVASCQRTLGPTSSPSTPTPYTPIGQQAEER